MTPAKDSPRRSTRATQKMNHRELVDRPESQQSSPKAKKRLSSAVRENRLDQTATSEDDPIRRGESPRKGRTKAAEVVEKGQTSSAAVSKSKVPPKEAEESPAKKKRCSKVPLDELGEIAGFLENTSKIFFFFFLLPSNDCFFLHQGPYPRRRYQPKLALRSYTRRMMN